MSDEKFPRAPDGFSYGDPALVVGGRDPRFDIDEHRRWTVHEYIPDAGDGHSAVRYREPTDEEWAAVGGAAMAAFDAIEAACPVCGGAGWTTEADPADQTGQTPMQVQCWDAEHVVVMEQRALLQAGRPVERKHDPATHECRGGVPGDRFPL